MVRKHNEDGNLEGNRKGHGIQQVIMYTENKLEKGKKNIQNI